MDTVFQERPPVLAVEVASPRTRRPFPVIVTPSALVQIGR